MPMSTELYSASPVHLPNALVPYAKRNVFSKRLKADLVAFGLQSGSGTAWETVPGGRASNGQSPAAVRVESVTWYLK